VLFFPRKVSPGGIADKPIHHITERICFDFPEILQETVQLFEELVWIDTLIQHLFNKQVQIHVCIGSDRFQKTFTPNRFFSHNLTVCQ